MFIIFEERFSTERLSVLADNLCSTGSYFNPNENTAKAKAKVEPGCQKKIFLENTRSMSMIRSLFKATKSGRDNMHFLAMAMSTQAMAGCPFLAHPPNPYPGLPEPKIQREFFEAVEKTNWNDVKSDLKQLFKDSKEFWPADYGHYGGLFIRMAWHSTGTYRERYV
jgi:hypothetical protein